MFDLSPFSIHSLLRPFLCVSCETLQYRPICEECERSWSPARAPFLDVLPDCKLYSLWFGTETTYRAFRQWKLTGSPRLRALLARIRSELQEQLANERVEAIVPIPQDPTRSWKRGFESAREAALVFSRELRCPLVDALELRPELSSRQQAQLARVDRMLGPNPFRLRPEVRLPGRILLVDDVVTTGMTVFHAMTVLAQQEPMPYVIAGSLVYKPRRAIKAPWTRGSIPT